MSGNPKIAWVVADETTGSKVAGRLVRERSTWVSAEGTAESSRFSTGTR